MMTSQTGVDQPLSQEIRVGDLELELRLVLGESFEVGDRRPCSTERTRG